MKKRLTMNEAMLKNAGLKPAFIGYQLFCTAFVGDYFIVTLALAALSAADWIASALAYKITRTYGTIQGRELTRHK